MRFTIGVNAHVIARCVNPLYVGDFDKLELGPILDSKSFRPVGLASITRDQLFGGTGLIPAADQGDQVLLAYQTL